MPGTIIIAPDSFKGSLTSSEVSQAIYEGIMDVRPDCKTRTICMSDGGDGMIRALEGCIQAEKVCLHVHGPIGRTVEASYLIADGTAIIEMAQASGLTCIEVSERNPLKTSTYGTGEIILHALGRGCRRFIIGLGGSATNDAGCGMMEALGCRFFTPEGKEITGCNGESLISIASMDTTEMDRRLAGCSFTAACDVDAVFTGPKGAVQVFAAQKGADASMMNELEKGMKSYESVILKQYGTRLSEIKGSGAAGGMGGCLHTFFNAEMHKGADLILEMTGFSEALKQADLVITGEGRIDRQTFMGKAPSEIAARAASEGTPVIAIGGIVENGIEESHRKSFKAILPICPRPASEEELSEAMNPETAKRNIRRTIATYLADKSI